MSESGDYAENCLLETFRRQKEIDSMLDSQFCVSPTRPSPCRSPSLIFCDSPTHDSVEFPSILPDVEKKLEKLRSDSPSSIECPVTENDNNLVDQPKQTYVKVKSKHVPEEKKDDNLALKKSWIDKILKRIPDGGDIELTIDNSRLVSDPVTKLLFCKSKKGEDVVEKRQSRDEHVAELTKRICLEKRRIWDEFQKPVDNYDDEEEEIKKDTNEADVGEENDGEEENNAEEENDEDVENDEEEEADNEAEEDDDEEKEGEEIDEEEENDEEEERESKKLDDIENFILSDCDLSSN